MHPVDQVSASFALVNLAVLAEHGRAVVKSASEFQKLGAGPREGNPILDKYRQFTAEDLEAGGRQFGDEHGAGLGMGLGGLAGAGGGALLARLMADEDEEEGETRKRMALAALGLGIPGALAGGWLGDKFGGQAGQAAGKAMGGNTSTNDTARSLFGTGIADYGGSVGRGIDAITGAAGSLTDSAKDYYANVLEDPLKGIGEGAQNLYGKLKGMFTEDYPGKAEGYPRYPKLQPLHQ